MPKGDTEQIGLLILSFKDQPVAFVRILYETTKEATMGVVRIEQPRFKGRCLCCGLTLTDAVSVERGIGPVCSREHYEGHDPSGSQFEAAIGRLIASQLPTELKNALFPLTQGRAFANALSRWASHHTKSQPAMIEVASVLGDLGFKVLADKVLARNTPVVITRQGGGYGIEAYSRPPMRKLLPLAGAYKDTEYKGRFSERWLFPESARGDIWAVAGVDFGGEWATVPGPQPGDVSEVKLIPHRGYKEVLRGLQSPVKTAFPATPTVKVPVYTITDAGTHLEIRSPYSVDFVDEIKRIKGRVWQPGTKVWEVPTSARAEVEALLQKHFP
jgi:hypothetical protein